MTVTYISDFAFWDMTLRLRCRRFGFDMTISMSFAFELDTKLLQMDHNESRMDLLDRNTKFSVVLLVLQMSL